MTPIGQLIINSPFREPDLHWHFDAERHTHVKQAGRRPAGYVISSGPKAGPNDAGQLVPIPLVNQIRPRVKAWREAGYPCATGTTLRLLEHWYDKDVRDGKQFFFCQIEAIETLIWLTEARASEHTGLDIPGDGGLFRRLCCKMATGTGKTTVMSMLIAWQVCNKAAYPQDARYSRNILVVAPGLTVKTRLQVLIPGGDKDYYTEFQVVPEGMREQLQQANVLVTNWHALQWDDEVKLAKRKGVDKRGAKSDEAYVREVLGDMARANNLVVINDEAHHAWRVPSESKVKGVSKEEIEEATKWIGGLDRINRARTIRICYDFSATPFAPSGNQVAEEALYSWIVSDFGLTDAIESGLVKTPRVVIRDDSYEKDAHKRSKLYHLYQVPEIKDDISRSNLDPADPLPDLLTNAYMLLARDWQVKYDEWMADGSLVPPVMLTVANNTTTAKRIEHAFDKREIELGPLTEPGLFLRIDSKMEQEVEAGKFGSAEQAVAEDPSEEEDESIRKLSKKDYALLQREKVDTVGKIGGAGQHLRNVISVAMLSEGWDAKNVTHIMGLRAFTSQLLCEQVVGRGLRRMTYSFAEGSDLLKPEYVNVFGVPFTFLPVEGGGGTGGGDDVRPVVIEPDPSKKEFEIIIPNIERIEYELQGALQLDLSNLGVIEIDFRDAIITAEHAPILNAHPNESLKGIIDLNEFGETLREQTLVFEAAKRFYNAERANWKVEGNLFPQAVSLVQELFDSDRLRVIGNLYENDRVRRNVVYLLKINQIVQFIRDHIRYDSSAKRTPHFSKARPYISTGDMARWYTKRDTDKADKSHINRVVKDSTWEGTEAFVLDQHPKVKSWVKNDHLGFEIRYMHAGKPRHYRPDFVIRLVDGTFLVLEVKGKVDSEAIAKQKYLEEWVSCVNQDGRFGIWRHGMTTSKRTIHSFLEQQ
jgi:type III restriction enzyme